MSRCSDYPNTALAAFYNIEIKVGQSAGTGTDASIEWQPVTMFTDCGPKCLVVSNDSPGGAVYLYYQHVAQDLYFIVDKGTFARDEVNDAIATSGGLFPSAFWLALEGFTVQQLTIDQPSMISPTLSGAFATLNGVTVAPSRTYPPAYDPSSPYTPHRQRAVHIPDRKSHDAG